LGSSVSLLVISVPAGYSLAAVGRLLGTMSIAGAAAHAGPLSYFGDFGVSFSVFRFWGVHRLLGE
jgi:hypothetical protein